MGATFYTEPLLTFDLDVFVVRSIVCSGAVLAPTSNPPAVIDRRYSDSTSSRKRSESMALRQVRRGACEELTKPSVLAARTKPAGSKQGRLGALAHGGVRRAGAG